MHKRQQHFKENCLLHSAYHLLPKIFVSAQELVEVPGSISPILASIPDCFALA